MWNWTQLRKLWFIQSFLKSISPEVTFDPAPDPAVVATIAILFMYKERIALSVIPVMSMLISGVTLFVMWWISCSYYCSYSESNYRLWRLDSGNSCQKDETEILFCYGKNSRSRHSWQITNWGTDLRPVAGWHCPPCFLLVGETQRWVVPYGIKYIHVRRNECSVLVLTLCVGTYN